MSPNASQQPVIALYSSTAHPHWSQIHHAAIQRQTVVTTVLKVLSRKMTPIDAAKWNNSVPTTQLSGERGDHSSHTVVTAFWPLRSSWTQHVPPWLGMSLWLALMIECSPHQTKPYYTRDASPYSKMCFHTCLPPPALICCCLPYQDGWSRGPNGRLFRSMCSHSLRERHVY